MGGLVRGVDVKKKAGNRPLYGQPQALGGRAPSGLRWTNRKRGVCMCVW